MKHMTRNLFAACILSLVFASVGNAQGAASPTETDAHFTKAQLNELERSTHTPGQYKVFASYYGGGQKSYLREAMEEKKEWVRRSQNVNGVNAKYPRPIVSARNLCEYYISLLSGCKTNKINWLPLSPKSLS
jgi:hypothetical protein